MASNAARATVAASAAGWLSRPTPRSAARAGRLGVRASEMPEQDGAGALPVPCSGKQLLQALEDLPGLRQVQVSQADGRESQDPRGIPDRRQSLPQLRRSRTPTPQPPLGRSEERRV